MSETVNVLESSRNPIELLDTIIALSESSSSDAHETMTTWLGRESFLNRLDSAKEYEETPKRLRLWRVLERLKNNPARSAHRVLTALTQSTDFLRSPARVELLIQACQAVRPAPPEVIRFWDQYCQPADGYCNLSIEAMLENGSSPALALFEKKMVDKSFADEEKTGWLLSSVLMHRNQHGVLLSSRRLLMGSLSNSLRSVLVDVLFDYKPAEWFSPAAALTPPDRSLASVEALAELRTIGDEVLRSFNLSEKQIKAVTRTLVEVNELLRKKS